MRKNARNMGRSFKRSMLIYVALVATFLISALGFSTPVKAANPTTISFQGKVVNAGATAGTNVTDGTYTFVFKLYTVSSAGAAIWTETDSSVTVTAGVFQINLGANCPFFTANACNSSTPVDFNANPNLYLGITFNSDPAGEMIPRVQLQSVPYAYNADKVGGFAASQLVQLSPSGQQTGTINISSTATAAGGVITPSLTTSGALIINSGAANNVTIDSAGAGTAAIAIGGTNATSVAIGRSGQTTTIGGALNVTETGTFNSNVIMTFTGTKNLAITSDLAGSVSGISFIGTPSTTAGATNGAFIQQAASANTNGLDNAITIDNANTTLAIGNAINITNTGGGKYTNYINSPGFIVAASGDVYGSGYDVFDPSALTQATGSTNLGSGGVTGGNFGSALSGGAFIGSTDTYSQEFVGSKAAVTTNNTLVGDDSKWFFNNNGAASGTVSDISATGGFLRLTTSTTTARGVLTTEGATGGAQDAPLLAANLPIVQMKARPSVMRITSDMVWGMTDTATALTANDSLPTNGIFFSSNNGIGATGWLGVVRSAGANVGTVTCPGAATANVFATGRIVVVNATTVRFFIDNDASNGVSFLDCGTVTGTLPAASFGMTMFVAQNTTTAATFDLDYARFWQDDAPPATSAAATNATASEQVQADIATGADMQVVTDPIANTTNSDSLTATPPDSSLASTGVPSVTTRSATSGDTTQLTNSAGLSHFSFSNNGDVTLAGSLNLGNAAISGGLVVGGDVTISGLSTFQKLATFLGKVVFRQDVQIDGHVTLAGDSAGYAKLRSGETSVRVTFKTGYDNPPIVSTSVTNGQFVLDSVSNVTNLGFDIRLQAPALSDTTFSWTAIGVSNPQTVSNPLPTSISPSTPLTTN